METKFNALENPVVEKEIDRTKGEAVVEQTKQKTITNNPLVKDVKKLIKNSSSQGGGESEWEKSIKDHLTQNGNTTEVGGDLEVDGNVKLNSMQNIEVAEKPLIATLLGIGADGKSKQIGVGDGLTIDNGVLKSTGGGTQLYKHSFSGKASWQMVTNENISGTLISTISTPITNDASFYQTFRNSVKIYISINFRSIFNSIGTEEIVFRDVSYEIKSEGLGSIYDLSDINDVVTAL